MTSREKETAKEDENGEAEELGFMMIENGEEEEN